MKTVLSTALLAVVVTFPSSVLALGEESFGNAPRVPQPDWAEGVIDVVNLNSRVYLQWVNGNEKFFYRGNAKALNEALRKYAAVKSEVHQLIVLPGSGKTHTFDRKVVDFDWQLHVPSGIYKAVAKKKHAVMTVYVNTSKPRVLPERKQIDLWLGQLDSDSFQAREKAEQELQKLGKDAKPLLREALKAQPGPESRRRIEGLLDKLHDFDVTDLEIPNELTVISVDDLLAVHLKGAKSPDAMVCSMAIQALTDLAPYSDRVVPTLTELLKKDKNEYVRRVAASSLAHIGVKARSAVPALKAGLDDPDVNIRNAFQAALDQLSSAKDKPISDDELKRRLLILKEISEFKKTAGGK
jgi:hypothetical protein